MDEGAREKSRLLELALLFFRLGVTAFGGPAAHIAMMEREVVRERKWLTSEELMDLIGAANLIPGPTSTELAIHIGHRRAGFPGLLVAGVCFIVPAAAITLGLAWVYVRFGTLPRAEGILYGLKPVIIAVVAQALVMLGRAAIKNWFLGAIAGACAIASFLGADELALLAAAGAIAMIARAKTPPMMLALAPASGVASATLGGLFLVFAKIGSVLFGSGYVLFAFLRADLVEKRHWLTEPQLVDAIAAGQVTPGPVFTTATFVGYLVRGAPGALVATLGIFLPAFVFVAISGPFLPRIRRSRRAGAFLDGVNAGSLGLMAAVTVHLGHTAILDVPAALIAVVSAVLLFRFRVSSVWLVFGGAIAGAIIQSLR